MLGSDRPIARRKSTAAGLQNAGKPLMLVPQNEASLQKMLNDFNAHHQTANLGVRGSNPFRRTIFLFQVNGGVRAFLARSHGVETFLGFRTLA